MTITAGSIVVGIDGSTSAHRALVWAAEQAAAEERVLSVVYAVPRSTPTLLDPVGNSPREARDLSLHAKGREVLDAAREEVDRLGLKVTVEDHCILEDAREALVDLSETASMVVLGSRGRGRMKSLLLGSTAVAVVRHARCPVVVHRPFGASVARGGIAVGADSTESSLPVLEFAYRQASLRNLPVTVVHTFWYLQQPSSTTDVRADTANIIAAQRFVLSESLSGLAEKYPDVTVHVEIDQGSPEEYLLRLADEMDLLVVGVHHGNRARKYTLGSVSVWLVEHATCPVGVVPLFAD